MQDRPLQDRLQEATIKDGATISMETKQPQRRFGSVASKMVVIFILVLLLLIPLFLISGILSERLTRRDAAVTEITSSWGQQQTIVGPVLTLPYRYYYKSFKEQVVNGKKEQVEVVEASRATAFFLPKDLVVDASLDPRELHRGIYKAVVYDGTIKFSGRFDAPQLSELKISADDVMWDEAKVTFGVTDLRGTGEALKLNINGTSHDLLPSSKLPGFNSGVSTRIHDDKMADKGFQFVFDLVLKGSNGIDFAPLGVQNAVAVKSSWPDPSFRGAFLPAERTISAAGFSANWKVSYYGRTYPQFWVSSEADENSHAVASIRESLFGVELMPRIDSYRNVERSIKYGILFFVLVFTAFFLFEVISKFRIHIFQYLLVGFALCLFYLALLSLSEFMGFGLSYLIGAAASTLLISLYSLSVLKSGMRTAIVALELTAIYGFLYVILQLQDYSLLIGTAGLFISLGIVMFVTRKIDWFASDNE